jgi:predicted helicase
MFGFSSENAERIKRQNEQKISVIIGNPPYNANQANFNDFNKNREYPDIDKRIKETYVKFSTAQKSKVYDMYARFYRWATDRLDKNGILAFVTNRSFIDSRTFDGFRKIISSEFNHIYIIDLGGDVRSNPKLSGPKHNVFSIQTGVAIMILVKDNNEFIANNEQEFEEIKKEHNMVEEPKAIYGERTAYSSKCRIYYYRRPEEELAIDKLQFLNDAKIQELAFDNIHPDKNNNWVNLSNDNDWESLIPVADNKNSETIFKKMSNGVVTARDEWVYDFDKKNIIEKSKFLSKSYNSSIANQNQNEEIKWSRDLSNKFNRNLKSKFNKDLIITSYYKPFTKKHYYSEKIFSDVLTQNHVDIFSKDLKGLNKCIGYIGKDTEIQFSTLAFENINDLNSLSNAAGGNKTMPLYIYDQEGNRHDNITDWGLSQFQEHYAPTLSKFKTLTEFPNGITKEAIFYYTYAVLHNPEYRKKYELNLKREFPRLPFYDDFFKWVSWGKQLMELHINYETVAPFDLRVIDNTNIVKDKNYKLKVKLKADKPQGVIAIDEHTYIHGVPDSAWAYKLGNRSAIEWVLDQYKEKKYTDKTIAEKFNTYRFADYKNHVIDLLKRVCTVSVETMKIIEEMNK